jgi:hypothetical protein
MVGGTAVVVTAFEPAARWRPSSSVRSTVIV